MGTLLALLLAAATLALILLGTARGEFDAELPKYEMLGVQPPPNTAPPDTQRLTPTDRIIRFGLLGPLFYYAGRLGWLEPAGILLWLIGVYCAASACFGQDPAYRLMRRSAWARNPSRSSQ